MLNKIRNTNMTIPLYFLALDFQREGFCCRTLSLKFSNESKFYNINLFSKNFNSFLASSSGVRRGVRGGSKPPEPEKIVVEK